MSSFWRTLTWARFASRSRQQVTQSFELLVHAQEVVVTSRK